MSQKIKIVFFLIVAGLLLINHSLLTAEEGTTELHRQAILLSYNNNLNDGGIELTLTAFRFNYLFSNQTVTNEAPITSSEVIGLWEQAIGEAKRLSVFLNNAESYFSLHGAPSDVVESFILSIIYSINQKSKSQLDYLSTKQIFNPEFINNIDQLANDLKDSKLLQAEWRQWLLANADIIWQQWLITINSLVEIPAEFHQLCNDLVEVDCNQPIHLWRNQHELLFKHHNAVVNEVTIMDWLLTHLIKYKEQLVADNQLLDDQDKVVLQSADFWLLYQWLRRVEPEQFESNKYFLEALFTVTATTLQAGSKNFTQWVLVLLSFAELKVYQPSVFVNINEQRLDGLLTLLAWYIDFYESSLNAVDVKLTSIVNYTLEVVKEDQLSHPLVYGQLNLYEQLTEYKAYLWYMFSDIKAYRSLPYRRVFERDLAVCFELSKSQLILPEEPISYPQFVSCMDDFLAWATHSISLSNDVHQAIKDIWLLPGSQNSSELVTLLDQEQANNCQSIVQLAGFFEWSIAARSIVWFSQRWPAYFKLSDFSNQFDHLIDIGGQYQRIVGQLDGCMSDDGLIDMALDQYALAFDQLVMDVKNYNDQFRTNYLTENADLDLGLGINQITNYAPLELVVKPCGNQSSCDVDIELEASKALFTLFPNKYLLAEQLGIGSVSLCYSNVEWVDREFKISQYGDPKVADYYGHLSFTLNGKYININAEEQVVFSKRLVSDNRYNYLFGENDESVLNDTCPRHLIGTKISSTIPNTKLSILPNRLTYLTADRTHPKRLFQTQWIHGEEWRDWFLNEQRVSVLKNVAAFTDEIDLAAQFEFLFTNLNKNFYQQVASDTFASIKQLESAKYLLKSIIAVEAFDNIVLDDDFRSTLNGTYALLGMQEVMQLESNNIDVYAVQALGRKRLANAVGLWSNRFLYDDNPVKNHIIENTLHDLKQFVQAQKASE